MKISTKSTINDLNNKPLDYDGISLTIGTVFERLLTLEPMNHIKPLKALAMAQRFHSGETIDFDDGDISDLRQAIEESKMWTPIVKGRILQIFANSNDEKD